MIEMQFQRAHRRLGPARDGHPGPSPRSDTPAVGSQRRAPVTPSRGPHEMQGVSNYRLGYLPHRYLRSSLRCILLVPLANGVVHRMLALQVGHAGSIDVARTASADVDLAGLVHAGTRGCPILRASPVSIPPSLPRSIPRTSYGDARARGCTRRWRAQVSRRLEDVARSKWMNTCGSSAAVS